MSEFSATTCVRAAVATDTSHGAVIPPLHLSTNFTFKGLGERRQYDYTRSGNPTRDLLAETLAELEGGHGAIVTSSGMAALTAIVHLVDAGQVIVAPHDCYGGTFRLLAALDKQGRARVKFVDQGDHEALTHAFREGDVGLVLVETPSNPLLRVVDIAKVSELCRRHGALLAADNTFLSPALQRPLTLGADLVVHSTTKYINGHSDVVGGAVIAKTPELAQQLTWWANCLGITGAPFDAFLTLRGVRTLPARIRLHEENANAIATFLNEQAGVSKVYYPGLASHPGHELAKKQQSGFGGIISFELDGGTAAVKAFTDGLKCFSLAESLGGVESLIAHPASMTHASMTPEAQARAGITASLVRISVGIEAKEDLLEDLRLGLERAAKVRSIASSKSTERAERHECNTSAI